MTSSASLTILTPTDLCVNGRGKRSVFCWCSFYPVLVLYLRSLCSGCSLLLTVSIMLYDFMPSWTFTILSIYGRLHTPIPATLLQQIYRATPMQTLTQYTKQMLTSLFVFIFSYIFLLLNTYFLFRNNCLCSKLSRLSLLLSVKLYNYFNRAKIIHARNVSFENLTQYRHYSYNNLFLSDDVLLLTYISVRLWNILNITDDIVSNWYSGETCICPKLTAT